MRSKRSVLGVSSALSCAGFALLLGCSAGDGGTEQGTVVQSGEALRRPPAKAHVPVPRGRGHGRGLGAGHGVGHGRPGPGQCASGGSSSSAGSSNGSGATTTTTGGVSSATGGSPGAGGFAGGGVNPGAGGFTSTGGTFGSGTAGFTGTGGAFEPGVCGDGQWGGGESCDDGNQQSGDGCSASCQVESGWLCSQVGEPCHQPKCGDGMTDSVWVPGAGGSAGFPGSAAGAPGTGGSFGYYVTEACDDGNIASGDGCSASCDVEAGFICPMPGEPCHQPTCGDGYQDFVPGSGNAGGAPGTATGGAPSAGAGGFFAGTGGTGPAGHYEGCDDGNAAPGDGCSATCEIEAGFICDLPGQPCRQPKCGDGLIDWIPGSGAGGAGGASSVGTGGAGATAGFPSTGGTSGGGTVEQCDDGNATPNDGCDATCGIEPGYSCLNPGLPCRVAVCGDGVTDYPVEQCDDGNNLAGDGCASCRWEWLGSAGGQAGFTGGTAGF